MSEGVTFERRWNGCNDLVVLQKINLDVIFITKFLWAKPYVTSPNFQRTTYHFLQERKIPKGHAR